MTFAFFLPALLALLLTPGPTNTLLALAAASEGPRRALRLIPAEVAAYLIVVIPVALLAGPWLGAHLEVASAATLAAALWVGWLALKLWRLPGQAQGAAAATFRDVFVTTLLNPKALVIGLALMPRGGFVTLWPWFAAFALTVCTVALIWILLGSVLTRGGGLSPALRRGAAGYLGLVALGLMFRGL